MKKTIQIISFIPGLIFFFIDYDSLNDNQLTGLYFTALVYVGIICLLAKYSNLYKR